MAASFQTYLAICSALTALAAVAAEDEFIKWGPSVTFKNGEYWGQSAVDVTTGYQVPHGTGTYISKQGHLLYAGKWWKGYMHGRGNRFYAVRNFFFFWGVAEANVTRWLLGCWFNIWPFGTWHKNSPKWGNFAKYDHTGRSAVGTVVTFYAKHPQFESRQVPI